MKKRYLITYSVPSEEVPGLFRHATTTLARPYPLTRKGICDILRDQFSNESVTVIDFEETDKAALQYDLFESRYEIESEDKTKKAVITQEKDGYYQGVLKVSEEGKEPALESKRSIRVSTIMKWARGKISSLSEQLNLTGI